MLKLFISIITFFIFSCGKSPNSPTLYNLDPTFNPEVPIVTYNVPTKFYNTYKTEFDEATAEIVSKTGKQLVRFVPNDNNPKYTDAYEALYNFKSTGEAWILFKETSDQFTNVPDGTAGYAFVGSPRDPAGVVVLNFSNNISWTGHDFRQVVDHEVLHCLGFEHTFGDDYSIMNYDFVYQLTGLTDLDTTRLAEKFPFSLEVVTVKDLEKYAALREDNQSEKYAVNLVENFGLSESRAQVISKHIIAYKKLSSTRTLTDRERDVLTREILGFGFEKGKVALEKYMQGSQDSLDDLIAVAASKNGTSPEQVKELFGEIFLK